MRRGLTTTWRTAAFTAALALAVTGAVTPANAQPAPEAPATGAGDGGAGICVGSNDATLGAVFDTILDNAIPILPAEMAAVVPELRAEAHERMAQARISMLSVSNPRSVLSDDPDAGVNTTNDPVATHIVTQLMNVRDGVAAQTIPVERLTLGQAIETAYFLIYTTTLVPASIVAGMIPSIMSVGPVSVGMLISLPLRLGVMGFQAIYRATQSSLEKGCVAVTETGTIPGAGEPDADSDTGFRPHPIVEELAATLAVSDSTCAPVSDMSLRSVLDRTVSYLDAIAPDEAARAQARDLGARLAYLSDTLMVPSNLIPENQDDFDTISSLLSLGLSFVPTIGGAATDALLGITNNLVESHGDVGLVPLGELTVDESLTAARYAYALTTQVMQLAWGRVTVTVADAIEVEVGVNPLSFLPSPFPIINAPNTYGLATYHRVLRSVCLTA
ncbi:hypothetical protein DW322_20895 [Rhodococcus rhodnii]|uniref:Secreted protein n=2 Tax=Rhodococcus rhodnii TaxID=38312 RepID=R7WMQ0_9NOCA|nr:hypothetical protein Rrhod_2113 [Rhodococcus rhodnii LMG 5362]TXG92178.1 hypothetical protein DW322_20895 [Rhodococcus rhodnii]